MPLLNLAMGAFLVAKAFAIAGIGPGLISIVLWILFGTLLGLPPIIGLLSSWWLWDPREALTGLAVQLSLFIGALWVLKISGLGDLSLWFTVFPAINGFFMAPAMVKERWEQVQKLKSEQSE